jgi:hypothetical protein
VIPADLLDLIAPASAADCTPGQLVAITVGLPLGLLLLWPVVAVVGAVREAVRR